jgi:hypothetical protein
MRRSRRNHCMRITACDTYHCATLALGGVEAVSASVMLVSARERTLESTARCRRWEVCCTSTLGVVRLSCWTATRMPVCVRYSKLQ